MRRFWPLVTYLLVACQPLPAEDVQRTLSDGEACLVGILATAQGTPDLAGLLKCGVTVADVWNLIVKLDRPSDAGASALSPSAVAWHQKLEGVKAQIREQHPEVAK